MLQTARSRKGDHTSTRRRLWRDSSGFRRIFLEAQMTTVLVIVADEFTHHALQLSLIEDDELAQQLTA